MSQKIGFIGLGRMGNPMAQNLVKAGFDVTVYDVVAAAMEPFAQQGVKTAASIAQLTRASDVIISIVPADKHIMSVYTDPQGVFDSERFLSLWTAKEAYLKYTGEGIATDLRRIETANAGGLFSQLRGLRLLHEKTAEYVSTVVVE